MNMTAEVVEIDEENPNEQIRKFCPPLTFKDEEEPIISSEGDSGEDELAAGQSSKQGRADEDRGVDEEETNPNQYGFVPCYRTFRDAWFWQEKPWDVSHLFMDLLMRANRRKRIAKHAGKVQPVNRGQIVTSKMKLAEDTGRDTKTITRWLKNLDESGEIRTESLGKSGIRITVCKYESYALDAARLGHQRGQHTGQSKGHSCG